MIVAAAVVAGAKFVSGAPDPRWSNDQLQTLGRVKAPSFEVVRYP